ncbi:MAG: hypothetical protein LLG00_02285, partial [Planctomycetaceae bacterium]|nr:hypothetical protein [Planctomycetaceae bacterium]
RPAASLPHDFSLTDVAPGFNHYLSRQAEIGRPLPGGYLARGWVAWLTWSIDALLVAAGALIVTLLALRVPYCNRCGQWYRTIRNGKIDLVTAARLATLLDVEPPEHPRSARYRLSMCQTGCGPMRCELSWEHGGSVELVQVWIDDRQRRELAAVLDRLADKSDNTDDD